MHVTALTQEKWRSMFSPDTFMWKSQKLLARFVNYLSIMILERTLTSC